MYDDSISKAITWIRNPEWGLITFILSTFILAASIFSEWTGIISAIAMISSIFAISVIAIANFVLSGIGVTCLHTDPESTAEYHYNRTYPMPDGYAEFEVYFSVPKWLKQFSVEIEHDGPFKMSAWELPDPASFNNGIIHCDGDLQKVPFILRFGGDPDEIRDASYNIVFTDSNTGKTIYHIELDGNQRVETDSSRDDIDAEIAERLELDLRETQAS